MHRRWRGRAVALEGQRLADVADQLKRTVLDVEVEVEFKRRAYAGQQQTGRRHLRLVGVRDPDSGSYWFYLTNIPTDVLDAESVARVYAFRWQIELVFKELKLHYRLDQLTTRKAPIVEALILSSISTLLVSRQRLRRHRHRIREGRWAALFAAVAHGIIDLLLLPKPAARAFARRLEPMLLYEALDPNVSRLSVTACRPGSRVGDLTVHQCGPPPIQAEPGTQLVLHRLVRSPARSINIIGHREHPRKGVWQDTQNTRCDCG